MKIAVVAPSCSLSRDAAAAVAAIVAGRGDCELLVHPQCFLSDGHFAGPDEARLAALREVMADPSLDAVWFARGGYGSEPHCRGRAGRSARGGAGQDSIWAIATRDSCSPGLHKAGSRSPGGRWSRTCCATAAMRPSTARSTGLSAAIRRARARPPAAGDGVQPGGAVEPARDAARARPHRRRSAHRGGRRAALSDRPRDVPCHGQCQPPQSRADCGSGGLPASSPTSPNLRPASWRLSRIGAAARASRSAAVPTSATTPPIGWSRSPCGKADPDCARPLQRPQSCALP